MMPSKKPTEIEYDENDLDISQVDGQMGLESTEEAPLPVTTNHTETAVTTFDDKWFAEHANLGLEEVTQEDMPTPTLTLIQKTSKLTDGEGRPYTPGKFYYRATQALYDEVEVSMLVFTKQMFPSYSNKEELEQTYVFLGALMPECMPFKMFLRSSGIGAAKQFIGKVKALKKPMFALKVKLSALKRVNDKGEYFVPQFDVLGVRESTSEIVLLQDLAEQYNEHKEKIKEESTAEVTGSTDLPFS